MFCKFHYPYVTQYKKQTRSKKKTNLYSSRVVIIFFLNHSLSRIRHHSEMSNWRRILFSRQNVCLARYTPSRAHVELMSAATAKEKWRNRREIWSVEHLPSALLNLSSVFYSWMLIFALLLYIWVTFLLQYLIIKTLFLWKCII